MLYTSLNRHLSIIPTHCSTNGRGVQARNLTAALSNTARSSNLTVKATATNKLSNTVDTGTGAGRESTIVGSATATNLAKSTPGTEARTASLFERLSSWTNDGLCNSPHSYRYQQQCRETHDCYREQGNRRECNLQNRE